MEIIQAVLMELFPSIPCTRKSLSHLKYKMPWDTMPVEIIARAAWHGLKQKLNDGLGAEDMTDAERTGIFNKTGDTLASGDWGADRESDPVEKRVKELARSTANTWAKANGLKTADLSKHAGYKAEYNRLLSSQKVRELAVKQVEEVAALAD